MFRMQQVGIVAAAGLALGLMPAFAPADVVPYGNVTVTTTTTDIDSHTPIGLLSNGIKSDTSNSSNTWDNLQAVHEHYNAFEAEFDLGQVYSLSQIDVSEVTAVTTGVGMPSAVDIWFSTTGAYNTNPDTTFTPSASGWTQSTGGTWADQVDQPIALSSSVSAQYVKMLFHPSTEWNAGVSEVQFVTATPEPASLALLGLGGLAMLRRRRRAYEA